MDAKLESWKGEHSESIVMDGVKIGKLETVKIREHRDGCKIGKLER